MPRSYSILVRSNGDRGAHCHTHRPCAQRAFTVIELLVVIAIVAILASLAGPSFRDFIIQQRIRTAAYDLTADLIFARSEAVKRNVDVTVTKAVASGTWADGWTIKDATDTLLREHGIVPATVTITMASGALSYSRNGRASPAASFVIDDAGGSAAIAARYVCVDQSGRPRSTVGSCT